MINTSSITSPLPSWGAIILAFPVTDEATEGIDTSKQQHEISVRGLAIRSHQEGARQLKTVDTSNDHYVTMQFVRDISAIEQRLLGGLKLKTGSDSNMAAY